MSSIPQYEITSPEGIVYTVHLESGFSNIYGYNAQVVKIENKSRTHSLNITYIYANGYSYINYIRDNEFREIHFVWDYNLHQLKSINGLWPYTINITYSYNTFTDSVFRSWNYLKEVKPPTGKSWLYTYYNSEYGGGQLQKMTYPEGGEISYTYADVPFDTGIIPVYFRVVKTRTTGGRDVVPGTWTYTYNSGGATGDVTTIAGPDGLTETYKFNGWGNCAAGTVWKIGLPISKSVSMGGLSLTENFSWQQGTLISNDNIANAKWIANNPTTWKYIYDTDIYVPWLVTKEIEKNGNTYTTTYSNYDSYGNPGTVVEIGETNRTTNRTYWYKPESNIVENKPLTESVSGSFSGTSLVRYSYYYHGGYLETKNIDGVTTSYFYEGSTWPNGNLSYVIDSNRNIIGYGPWSNGRPTGVSNSIYIQRIGTIKNGTITDIENGREYITSFQYDANLQLIKVTPPAGNPININYPTDGSYSYKKTTRGSYWRQDNFDGFGRPRGSVDSKGVTTTIGYKASGSLDYKDSNIGDKISYDLFGRVTQILHKDNNKTTYTYSGNVVTTTNENGAQIVLTYNSFGNPDEKYLVSVKDALNNTASYTYDIRGNLTSITFGGLTRTFLYNSKYFLISETNPETGTITYGRDNVGNLTSKTDATGTTTYGYDDIYRLTSVTSGGSNLSFGYDYADNRTSAVSPSANQTFTYDAANRLTKKSETILGTLYATQFAYDANDNLTSITYPSNRVISYAYNGNNEVTAVPGYVTSASYNLAGQPLSCAYANGITNTFTYNTRNLPTGITAGSVLNLTYGVTSLSLS